MNKCLICNKEYEHLQHLVNHIFQSHQTSYKDYYDKFLKKDNEGICKVCKNITSFFKGKYRTYCSRKCQNSDVINREKNSKGVKRAKNNRTLEDINKENLKRDQTILDKYGVQNISQLDETKEKVKHSNIENYGDWYLNTNECKQAFKEKYGVDNALQVPSILTKVQQTNIGRYGEVTPAKNKDVQDKISNTKIQKTYSKFLNFSQVEPLFDIKEYTGKNILKNYDWKCKKCKTVFQYKYQNGIAPICPKCYPPKRQMEAHLYELLKQIYKDEIIKNNRKLFDTEFDFYLPKEKIAIELNGLYWHSEINGEKNRKYHLHKTEIANNNNIQLIHIFEDELIYKEKILQSRLKHILGLVKRKIYGRKCEIKTINNELKNKFLNKYHIQGEDNSCISLGAYYNNRLVAVMTFSKLRIALGQKHQEQTFELSRFCTIASFNIIGIADKLLTYFERTYNPKKIITYADRRWSQGKLYYKLGFKLDHISKPNYWYVPYGGRRRYYRFNFRKSILKDKIDKFNPELTEWQNMQMNGFDRIWDCGNLVFVKLS